MTLLFTLILFFAFALVLIWLWTRKKGAYYILGPSKFPVSFNSGTLGGTAVHTRIVFNGKVYSSPEEMPPEVREVYDKTMSTVLADSNLNGVPDIFETGDKGAVFHTDVLARTLEDPAEKLKKLKEMKDSGLITEQDYESKKSEILKRM